jgi:hypothetical protein
LIDGFAFPCSASQSVIARFASAAGCPSNCAEFISLPSSPITGTTGRSYVAANSASRSSCAGTAMIAPVPYSIST